MVDINRAALRRSKLTSSGVLMIEQIYSWELLHPQATPMQHRGDKHYPKYGLKDNIILLSLA